MWYQIMPAAGLIIGFTLLPMVSGPVVKYLFIGKPHARHFRTEIERDHWRRDMRLSKKKNLDGHFTRYLDDMDLP